MVGEERINLDRESFKALSSEVRINVLKMLDDHQMTLSDLSRAMGATKQSLLRHLEALISADLVKREDEGRKWIYYSLARKGKRILHPERAQISVMLSAALFVLVGGSILLWRSSVVMTPPTLDPGAEPSVDPTLLGIGISLIIVSVILTAAAWWVWKRGRLRSLYEKNHYGEL